MSIAYVGDLVLENGKTWYQDNMDKSHKIPIGALIEISYDELDEDEKSDSLDGLRLFVTGHSRDCDGTPLYELSHNRKASEQKKEFRRKIDEKEWLNTPDDIYAEGIIRWNFYRSGGEIVSGMSEDSLKVIRLL